MKTGETKFYRVAGILYLIGRQYGYIVQLHYFNMPGYKVNKTFDSLAQAEKYFDDVLKAEV